MLFLCVLLICPLPLSKELNASLNQRKQRENIRSLYNEESFFFCSLPFIKYLLSNVIVTHRVITSKWLLPPA